MPEANPGDKTVRAAPTKRFFISVLVKDIYLIDAIVELVDNSIDSARSKFGADGLGKIFIEVSYDDKQFSIADNAGGISIDQARNYAFRFGRPEDAPVTPGSVGEFGVGMKRALFKLGRQFSIKSRTAEDFFEIDVDVDAWESLPEEDPNAWNFEFSKFGKNDNPEQNGTAVTVSHLYDYVTEEFINNNFGTRLIGLLRQTHSESLSSGLQISVNKTSVSADVATLLSSGEIFPINKTMLLDIGGKEVNVRLMAGIGDAKLPDAGWYIFCNGRQIERAEKTEKTAWNSVIDDDHTTPKSHWQFRRFRGYVFFESRFPDVLPWNTTKTMLDVEAPAYRRVKPDMGSALLQVIEFLNALDAESGEPGPLTAIVQAATPTSLMAVPANDGFKYTATPATIAPKNIRISYARDSDIVQRVKESLGVRSYREIGERTFDYYVDAEGLNG